MNIIFTLSRPLLLPLLQVSLALLPHQLFTITRKFLIYASLTNFDHWRWSVATLLQRWGSHQHWNLCNLHPSEPRLDRWEALNGREQAHFPTCHDLQRPGGRAKTTWHIHGYKRTNMWNCTRALAMAITYNDLGGCYYVDPISPDEKHNDLAFGRC